MLYIYDNVLTPNLSTSNDNEECISGIHYDIISSDMSNKDIDYCTWDESELRLKIYFLNALSIEDKELLDTIVSNNA